MPAPVINTSISLDGTAKNTLTIPDKIAIEAIILAILALSIKLNDYSPFLLFLGFSMIFLIVVSWHTLQYP